MLEPRNKTSVFERGVVQMLSGAKNAKQGARMLAEQAVRLTLDKMVETYPFLDYAHAKQLTMAPVTEAVCGALDATDACCGGVCMAITAKGNPCTRKARPGSHFCKTHKDAALPPPPHRQATRTRDPTDPHVSRKDVYRAELTQLAKRPKLRLAPLDELVGEKN
jgi:hypothetical protein